MRQGAGWAVRHGDGEQADQELGIPDVGDVPYEVAPEIAALRASAVELVLGGGRVVGDVSIVVAPGRSAGLGKRNVAHEAVIRGTVQEELQIVNTGALLGLDGRLHGREEVGVPVGVLVGEDVVESAGELRSFYTADLADAGRVRQTRHVEDDGAQTSARTPTPELD